MRQAVCAVVWLLIQLSSPCIAQTVSRAEVIAVARSYAEHPWSASERNAKHGVDRAGVLVHTPDAQGPDEGRRLWKVGSNIGVPYKWGGFDSLQSFNTGIAAGKAAGDLYSSEKRKKGGAAVSPYAVGIDCSGFISRCWKLPKKYSTHSLVSLCRPLASAQDLRPGDVMNPEGGHVRLFAEWLDETKTKALFYEAEPFSKVIAQQYDVTSMLNDGYRPFRYKQLKD